jgi:ADP-ribose pyrophosphatase YjhB (NUDIX family)
MVVAGEQPPDRDRVLGEQDRGRTRVRAKLGRAFGGGRAGRAARAEGRQQLVAVRDREVLGRGVPAGRGRGGVQRDHEVEYPAAVGRAGELAPFSLPRSTAQNGQSYPDGSWLYIPPPARLAPPKRAANGGFREREPQAPGGYARRVRVRVTGVVIEDGRILLLNQDADEGRAWSLPGGKLEDGETLAGALVREMKEETGLDVVPGRLLYVCDHLAADVVHLTFEARRTGGTIGGIAAGADTTVIRGVEFVPLAKLPGLGFSDRFAALAMGGFPGAGSYMGPKSAIGL